MQKFIKIIQKIEEGVMVACLCTMGIVLSVHVFFRFCFDMPIPWAEELARYLQIWITFIGIGYGVRRKTHVSMPMIRNMMPRAMQYIAQVVCDISIIICSFILLWVTPEFMSQQIKLSSAMHIPMYIVYAAIPIGFVSYIIYLIAEMVKYTIAFKAGKDEIC